MKKLISKVSFKQLVYSLLILIGCFIAIKVDNVDKKINEMSHSDRGFKPEHVLCKFDYRHDWDIAMSDELLTFVNVITQQPFYWLGKGFQVYAFESQDGEYVLKFFQQQRLREKTYKTHPLQLVFSKKFREKVEFVNNHREEIFSSSKISFEEIPEETGIVFVHLNRSDNLLRGIRLYDQKGESHKIHPDKASFIIQKKANYVLPTITEHMKNDDINGAKARIDQIFTLLVSLARKGIVDSDYALIRNNNMGFVKDRAVYIDTGHLAKHENLNVLKQMKYEFKVRLKPLQNWLMIRYPELHSYYQEKKDALLVSLGDTLKEESVHQEALAASTKEMK